MPEETLPAKERSLAALITAFLLAAVHQYLFFDKIPGVSYPIFVCLFYGYALYFAKARLRPFNWFSYTWLGAIALLSLTYALFFNKFFFGLNFILIPGLVLLHMTYMLSVKRPSWSSFGLIGNALEHFFPQNLRHWVTALRIVKKSGGGSIKDERKQVLVKVLIGLAISFPLLLIVISLLSSADGVFQNMLSELPKLLDKISFGEGVARFLWIFLLGLGCFGFIWGFLDTKIYQHKVEIKDELLSPQPVSLKIDPVILTTILVAINLVYVLFVVVQFSYLFGAWEGALPEGTSYAEYARSGFFELILVTSINFVILLLSLLGAEKGKAALQKIINILLYVLVGCSTVMLYSAYTRLALYEEVYGYTYIRFLVHAFMIFLGLLLIIAALRIAIERVPLAKCYIVLGLVSYVLMNYIGMDRIIVNQNLDRYADSGKLDTAYIVSLAPEIIPTLIDFSRDEKGMLDEELRNQWWDNAQETWKWQSFNVSRHRAQKALEDYFTH
ncbi:DUF4153 domain-containing protein [Paenibacillus sp. sgz500958]|uniref:DUF4153 domain-containing protein n=1 Tax=Paenibacillus sp. sgz500958 TaxID=3242475 RepID=UPI0036D34BDC